MFKIYENRAELWQWDLNQKLIVDSVSVNEVHFCDGINSQALVCQVYDLDGLRVVDIPNIMLQDNCDLNVYAFVAAADGSYTKHREIITVNKRSRPADYVYTETQVKSYEALEKKIEEMGGLTDADVRNIVNEEIPTIPTKLSQLENDSNFVDKDYVDTVLGSINAELATLTEVAE